MKKFSVVWMQSQKEPIIILRTIRIKPLLQKFGWKSYPSYVTAHPKLWQQWYIKELRLKYKGNNNNNGMYRKTAPQLR